MEPFVVVVSVILVMLVYNFERVEEVPLLVVKKTVREQFSRDKIFNGYLDECSEASGF